MKISPQSYLRYNAVTLVSFRCWVPPGDVTFSRAASEIVLVLEYVSISLLEFLVRKSSSTCLFCFLLFKGKETSSDS